MIVIHALRITVYAAALSAAAATTAQTPPATAQPVEDVVVRARTNAAIDQFVAALTQTERGRQISRWNNHVCPRVIGLNANDAAFIEKSIAAQARMLGTPVARGRCAANIVVVATDDADGFARGLVERHPRLFREGRLARPAEIATLLAPHPVRWIAVSRTDSSTYQAASRLMKTSIEDAKLSILIVDTRRLDRITWRQLADYLALVAFARPKMGDEFAADTILSIFAARDRGERGPQRLTEQDRRFLSALYNTTNSVDPDLQRAQIRGQMKRRVPDAE